MKKFLAVSAVAVLGFSSIAFAGGLPEEMPIAPIASASSSDMIGPYVGISGGYDNSGWKEALKHPGPGFKVKNSDGFVGRAFIGYDVIRYAALEAGYSYFFNKTKHNPVSSLRTMAFDLMLKLKAPVVEGFDLFAKVGGNLLMSQIKNGHNINNFNVAYGAGADYSITPNVIASVEWLRFNGKSQSASKDFQPSADTFLLGLRYRFDI